MSTYEQHPVSVKNLLSQYIDGVGIYDLGYGENPGASTPALRQRFGPHETIYFGDIYRAAISDQMWNLIERGILKVRVGDEPIANRNEDWPPGTIPDTPLPEAGLNDGIYLSTNLAISTHAGACIRVRRASDNAEQDIGFDSLGWLDTAALEAFCAGSQGFVTKWYTQAPLNSSDVTQTNAARQPEATDALGAAHRDSNGNPTIYFNGGGQVLDTPGVTLGGPRLQVFAIFEQTISSNFDRVCGSSLGPYIQLRRVGGQDPSIDARWSATYESAPSVGPRDVVHAAGFQSNGISAFTLYVDGVAQPRPAGAVFAADWTANNTSIRVGNGGSGGGADSMGGYIGEVFCYANTEAHDDLVSQALCRQRGVAFGIPL